MEKLLKMVVMVVHIGEMEIDVNHFWVSKSSILLWWTETYFTRRCEPRQMSGILKVHLWGITVSMLELSVTKRFNG